MGGQLANGADAMGQQLGLGFGAYAIDLAARQRPNLGRYILRLQDGDAIGFVQLAGHLGQQLVGCHANRAGQARGLENAFLDQSCQHPATLALTTRYIGEVDVHLVHTAVFHQRGNLCDEAFELSRVVSVLLKIHGQQNRIGAQLGRFHHAHG